MAAEEMQRFGPELLTSMLTYSEKVQNEGILHGLRTDSVLDGGLPYGLLLTSVFTADVSYAKQNVPIISNNPKSDNSMTARDSSRLLLT